MPPTDSKQLRFSNSAPAEFSAAINQRTPPMGVPQIQGSAAGGTPPAPAAPPAPRLFPRLSPLWEFWLKVFAALSLALGAVAFGWLAKTTAGGFATQADLQSHEEKILSAIADVRSDLKEVQKEDSEERAKIALKVETMDQDLASIKTDIAILRTLIEAGASKSPSSPRRP